MDWNHDKVDYKRSPKLCKSIIRRDMLNNCYELADFLPHGYRSKKIKQ